MRRVPAHGRIPGSDHADSLNPNIKPPQVVLCVGLTWDCDLARLASAPSEQGHLYIEGAAERPCKYVVGQSEAMG